jgi:transcriptional regulator with XRE-family HTH domain
MIKYRLKYGLSQKQIGIIIGVSQGQVSKWEKGSHVPSKLREHDIRMRI